MSAARARFPHVLIRASAGTGKTFQLSNRFISLAAAGEGPDSILATTFTRKAAGEILERVISRLAEAALDGEKAAQLSSHLDGARLDRAACLRILHEFVRQVHRLRVGTLDSFFIQAAGSFSLELSLPPGWKIVDEIVDRRLRAQAVRAVLRNESTRDAVELMHLLTKGEATRRIGAQIASLVDDLYEIYLEAPDEAWRSLPRPAALKAPELQAALDALAAVEIVEGKRFATARDADLDSARDEAWEVFVSKGLAGKIVAGTGTYYRKPIPPELVAAYEPVIKHARAVLLQRIANQNEATQRLLARFDEAYQLLKISHRALRFEDVTRRLAAAWATRSIDEVIYRLDAHVAHLLLDEFQDTSPLQWRVLRPFARQVVDGGGRRSFFCVGDVKQAIFGWRGGSAEIFEALSDELGELVPRSLERSYRSSPVVIDTVNRVFENLAHNAALQNYLPAARCWAARFRPHDTARTELPGYCRMISAPAAEDRSQQKVRTVEFAAEEAARLHQRAPGRSMGILVRKNETVARMIYLLHSRGIDASEEGGNPLGDSPAVQLLLSLLKLADHPGDTTAAFHVANSPLAEHVGLKSHADSAVAWRVSQQVREALMTRGYGPTLYGWVEMLARACDRRDLSRLLQLVEMGYAYESQATARADDFVSLVTQQRVEDPSSAGVRVMTVHQAKGLQFDIVVLPELDARMSGQTPQMVVGRPTPGGDVQHVCRYVGKEERALLPHDFQEMFATHQRRVVEESLCVLYVSLTRAVHALHMIVAPPGKSIGATPAGLLRAALSGGEPIGSDGVLYEHGDAAWFEVAEAKPAPAKPEKEPKPLCVKLATPPKRPGRGLDRRSPSQLEGGPRVDLAAALRLDTDLALNRGSLIHAWFELITWLEDGQPDDAALHAVADKLDTAGLDVPALIGEFRAALAAPAIRAVLSRSTYEEPAEQCAIHVRRGMAAPQWKVWRERPFAVHDGDAILSGAIDRLVVLYDGERAVAADVVDFKSDALAPGDPGAIAARREVYRPQLDAYRRAVAAMFKLDAAHISARLVFTVPGVIEGV